MGLGRWHGSLVSSAVLSMRTAREGGDVARFDGLWKTALLDRAAVGERQALQDRAAAGERKPYGTERPFCLSAECFLAESSTGSLQGIGSGCRRATGPTGQNGCRQATVPTVGAAAHSLQPPSQSAGTSGSPTGRSSGNGTNSRIFVHRGVKSLFTSPERQSVISPAASGYFSMTRLKEKSGL